jgi:hypothetical protein
MSFALQSSSAYKVGVNINVLMVANSKVLAVSFFTLILFDNITGHIILTFYFISLLYGTIVQSVTSQRSMLIRTLVWVLSKFIAMLLLMKLVV